MAEITGVFGAASSFQEPHKTLFDGKLPVGERVWGSETRRPQVVAVLFDGEYAVERVTAAEIGSDQTTEGVRWEIHLRHADGGYTVTPVVAGDYNVVRGGPGGMGFSVDKDAKEWPLKDGWTAARTVKGALDFKLPSAQKAVGGELRISGHGWFRVVGLVFHGSRVGDFEEGNLEKLKDDYAKDLKAL